MSDISPDNPIDELLDFTGAPQQPLSEQREHGFQIMKARMLEVVAGQIKHVPQMMRGSALHWYAKGIDDSINIFRQITDRSSDEELTAG
jgi:hypothetical protein